MSGRNDYKERREKKREKYQDRAEKARKNSQEHYAQYEKRSSMIPLGQPILTDHYSANRHRSDLKKINRSMEKSIEEEEKAKYYEEKIDNIDNNNTISSDDPQAIEKLKEKLKGLETRKEEIKAREHEWYELPYINKEIKAVKERIKELEELDQLEFKDIIFNGGKIIRNKEQNRIQILFDEKPSEQIRDKLKHRGFKWARSQGAWQRLFNKNAMYAANRFLEEYEQVLKGDNAVE